MGAETIFGKISNLPRITLECIQDHKNRRKELKEFSKIIDRFYLRDILYFYHRKIGALLSNRVFLHRILVTYLLIEMTPKNGVIREFTSEGELDLVYNHPLIDSAIRRAEKRGVHFIFLLE